MTPEESIAPSGGPSIGDHVLETNRQSSRSTRSVEKILGAHPIDDDLLGQTNSSDVSIDTANSKEIMTGSHITYNIYSSFKDLFNLNYLT